MVVIDTSVISETSRPRPNPHVDAWLCENLDVTLGLSVAVVFEIQRGIEMVLLEQPDRAGVLTSWLEGLLLRSNMNQIQVCVPTARLWARMVARPELRRLWMSDPQARKPKYSLDLLIAATAIIHEVAVVTMDKEDFALIDSHFPLPGIICPRDRPSQLELNIKPAMAANDDGTNHPAWKPGSRWEDMLSRRNSSTAVPGPAL